MCDTYREKVIYTYTSTDNSLSSIPVSDLLIFCCGNSILIKKINENDKNKFFDEKQQQSQKKCQESVCKW